MTFDAVSKVELYSDATDGWVDRTSLACPTVSACDGKFPGYTPSAALQADTLGVRLTIVESPTRAARITGPLDPPVGSGVAASEGNDPSGRPGLPAAAAAPVRPRAGGARHGARLRLQHRHPGGRAELGEADGPGRPTVRLRCRCRHHHPRPARRRQPHQGLRPGPAGGPAGRDTRRGVPARDGHARGHERQPRQDPHPGGPGPGRRLALRHAEPLPGRLDHGPGRSHGVPRVPEQERGRDPVHDRPGARADPGSARRRHRRPSGPRRVDAPCRQHPDRPDLPAPRRPPGAAAGTRGRRRGREQPCHG